MAVLIDDTYYHKLHELQSADFTLVELTLYLDTHPYDEQAVYQFNQFAQYSKGLREDFEKCYGPLLQFGLSYSECPWQWIDCPWPWQV